MRNALLVPWAYLHCSSARNTGAALGDAFGTAFGRRLSLSSVWRRDGEFESFGMDFWYQMYREMAVLKIEDPAKYAKMIAMVKVPCSASLHLVIYRIYEILFQHSIASFSSLRWKRMRGVGAEVWLGDA